MSGRVSYLAGIAAEDSVEREYARLGYDILKRRWRGSGGEIDLIFRAPDDGGFIFVEVKKSRDFARAAEHLSAAQIGRICTTASEFAATQPGGMLADLRIDLAMVDQTGQVARLENITV